MAPEAHPAEAPERRAAREVVASECRQAESVPPEAAWAREAVQLAAAPPEVRAA